MVRYKHVDRSRLGFGTSEFDTFGAALDEGDAFATREHFWCDEARKRTGLEWPEVRRVILRMWKVRVVCKGREEERESERGEGGKRSPLTRSLTGS